MNDYNNHQPEWQQFSAITAADWARGLKAARERRATVSDRHPTHNQLKKAVMEKQKINWGEPVFPSDHFAVPEPGIFLRDYFAAKALAGMLSGYIQVTGQGTDRALLISPTLATTAYNLADAMLAARNAPLTGA